MNTDKRKPIYDHYIESKRIINEAMRSGQLVLFVGAGASVCSGMPTWGQAVLKISERLGVKAEKLDYQRIPQYYYNTYGKTKYNQLMQQVFKHGMKLSVHDIQRKIMEFEVDTILTTNYDHLLEWAAEEKAQVLNVISKDADLPYRNGGKELIKLHGDFENDNYVLKESDYIEYSRNFRLIENYAKSLIGTKVVLFIGYSFSDPDVKQLFDWVKDILGENFQRAYLLEVGSEYDFYDVDYYKSFGINLLYASAYPEEISYDSNNKTQNLLNMLDWLKKPETLTALEELHKNLNWLNEFDYVYSKYIVKPLIDAGFYYDDWEISLNDFTNEDSEAYRILFLLAYIQFQRNGEKCMLDSENNPQNDADLKNELNKRYEKYTIPEREKSLLNDILDVLKKSLIGYIVLDIRQENLEFKRFKVEIGKKSNPEWFEDIYSFDQISLFERIQNNEKVLLNANPELYMEQGFLYLEVNNYLAAYSCYKNAKGIFYKNRQLTKYFIAEMNCYLTGKAIVRNGFLASGLSDKELNKIEQYVDSTNLEKTYKSIFGTEDSNVALKDLYTFNIAYVIFQDAYRLALKIQEQANTNYIMFCGDPAFAKLKRNLMDYYRYICSNGIVSEKYIECTDVFKIYFYSIFSAVFSRNYKNESGELPNFIGHICVEKLSDFEIAIGLRYLSFKDLENLIGYGKTMIPMDEDAMKYLQNAIERVVIDSSTDGFFRFSVFYKIILLLANCHLSNSIVTEIEKKFREYKKVIDFVKFPKALSAFWQNVEKQNLIKDEWLDEIEANVSFILNNESTNIGYRDLLFTFLWILKNHERCYNKITIIEKLISQGKALETCADIYGFLGIDAQGKIYDNFSDWHLSDECKEGLIYCKFVMAGIIDPNIEEETRILNYCLQKSDSSIFKNFERDFDTLLINHLIELSLENKICEKELLKRVVTDKNVGAGLWLIDYDDFDYSKFNVNWLEKCTSSLLRDLSKDEKTKKNIAGKIREEYMKGMVSEKITKIYFEYFAE